MIYTIGRTLSYEQYFEEQDQPKKLGRENNYEGGSVFKTQQDAEVYLVKNGMTEYSVYGVLADWETDTIPNAEGNWHDLLVTSPLIRLR